MSSLRRALATLDEALAALARAPEDKFIRDACIQRFEYSYELAYKTLRRHLEATEPHSVAELSFPQLIRLGYDRSLLAESWDVWADFRDARNATSRAYNEDRALAVIAKLPGFAKAAVFLATQIEARQS
ncbi:HI0074 family nucleotidyltransferase substrate-binding subunit [Acidocella sp. KAb 2-4]|uniref:HI0074 family nucleotidyltransferase substrate-binding subunit n=1 Tax=Acidocella sp. KAb 2-4 TaxID=2885158 RepID=UPI001D087FE0|nr:HI0074 family nucleotidyltransferase substrate-binding subunit [Acidocella sp. KAb 2-4]MCB5944930.1 nucleotidyltransferase substrate binding protein [Acidocella sp. KAb 2-4]